MVDIHTCRPIVLHLVREGKVFCSAVILHVIMLSVNAVLGVHAGLIQLGAVATFGGGASRPPYNSVSDPTDTTPLLGRRYSSQDNVGVYLGWSYWLAVVADMLTVVAGTFFIITAFCVQRKL